MIDSCDVLLFKRSWCVDVGMMVDELPDCRAVGSRAFVLLPERECRLGREIRAC